MNSNSRVARVCTVNIVSTGVQQALLSCVRGPSLARKGVDNCAEGARIPSKTGAATRLECNKDKQDRANRLMDG